MEPYTPRHPKTCASYLVPGKYETLHPKMCASYPARTWVCYPGTKTINPQMYASYLVPG